MTKQERLIHHIIATDMEPGRQEIIRVRLGEDPIHVGSSDKANIQLDGIEPMHARVILTKDNKVLLINLAAHHSVDLNNVQLQSFIPTEWQPGKIAFIEHYKLQLATLVVSDDAPRQPTNETITQESHVINPAHILDTVTFSQAKQIKKEIEPPETMPEAPKTINFTDEPSDLSLPVIQENPWETIDDTDVAGEPSDEEPQDPVPVVNGRKTPENPPIAEQTYVDPESTHVDNTTINHHVFQTDDTNEMMRTPLKPISKEILEQFKEGGSGPLAPVDLHETLPRDWQSIPTFSVQLIHNPLKLFPGERVRIPLSIRNQKVETLSLRINIAGIPRNWITLPPGPISTPPGAINSTYLILEPPHNANMKTADIIIRFSDISASDAVLTLTQNIIFKDSPNIVGELQPRQIFAGETGRLNLHNHTQSSIEVFITCHSDPQQAILTPALTQVDLPPGHFINIPLHIKTSRKRLFSEKTVPFSLVVAQYGRGTLDFPGEIIVPPYLRRFQLLLITLAVLVMITILLMLGIYYNSVNSNKPPLRDNSGNIIEPTQPGVLMVTVIVPTSSETPSPEPSPTIEVPPVSDLGIITPDTDK